MDATPLLAYGGEPRGAMMTSLGGERSAVDSRPFSIALPPLPDRDLPLSSFVQSVVWVVLRKGNFPWLDWHCNN